MKRSRGDGDSAFFRVGHGVGSDAGTGCCASISYIFGLALANELETPFGTYVVEFYLLECWTNLILIRSFPMIVKMS